MSSPKWEKPRTNKVYLHPPFAERLQVLWPDFKITNSDIVDNNNHLREHGSGFIVLRGEQMEQVDYRRTRFAPVRGGLPQYTVISEGDIELSLETFSNFDRNATVFARITAKNTTNAKISDCIGILPRTGCETYMMNEHDTGYTPYYPNVKNWYMLKRTWTGNADFARDDEGTSIRLQKLDGFKSEWVADGRTRIKFEASDFFRLSFDLEAGQSASVELSFHAYQDAAEFDFSAEKAENATEWAEILSKVKIFPNTDNEIYQHAYLRLITACMQMLAHYRGSDYVVSRQGDVGRFVWPTEAERMLIPMEDIGLSDYTIGVYDYFFGRWMQDGGVDDGKICSIHQQWGRMNGSVLHAVGHRLLTTKSRAEYEHFRPYIMRCYDWIQRERKKSSTDGISKVKGIFPVSKGCDWDDVGQFWNGTDAANAEGMATVAEAFALFGDPEADRMKKEAEEYFEILRGIFADLYQGHENDDEFIFEHMLGVSFEDSERYPHTAGPAGLVVNGIIAADSPAFDKMENFFRRTGRINESGLIGLMTSCTCYCDEAYFGGYGDVYYTISGDRVWMKAWLMRGEREKAAKVMNASFKYALTTEFNTSERYCSTDPWYSPWQPNASGSAMFFDMMLDFFGRKTK